VTISNVYSIKYLRELTLITKNEKVNGGHNCNLDNITIKSLQKR